MKGGVYRMLTKETVWMSVTEIKKGFPPVCTCLAGISGLKPMLRSARLLLPLFCFGLQFHRFIIPCQLLTE